MNDGRPRLTVWMDAAGRVQVNGPIGNKGLCYMLLECAKDAIRDYVEKNQGRVTVPEIQVPKDITGDGN